MAWKAPKISTGAYQLRPASRPPIVKHFQTHTSGLAYPFTSAIWRDFKRRAGETYPFGGPLLFDPGERWHYSTSTDVVGKLVEVVSGQKFEDYFRQYIFAPLKKTRRIAPREGNVCLASVIASAAKQSMSPRKGRMDCLVASLLAMTKDLPLARFVYFIS